MDVRANENPVVISGIGGRYPESDSVDEFAANLFNNVDMITDDDRRWPTDLYDMNHRMGKLKRIDKYDGAFFGLPHQMGDEIDPGARILLETTYEAICDAGINPQSLRGTRTGVYVGHSTLGMPDGFPTNLDPTSLTSLKQSMFWAHGTGKAMYANRLSFCFDFRGPSMMIDTACSSSMVAFDVAVNDIRAGKCDQAIVAGVNINMQAFTNYFYQKFGFNSPVGMSRVWDAGADGFVRSETVASLFLQRELDARRVYGRVLNSRTNTDGYKKTGMSFPSSDAQMNLLIETYQQVNLDPSRITYFEAHGTGTEVGDFQEASAIHRAYCADGRRTGPLPIGLLKSNIGHGEAASGVASLTKVIISFENGCIPANLNLKTVKANIAELSLLKPITDNLPYTPGIVGVNSFGVGGVNGHALLEPNHKTCRPECREIASAQMPRLVLLHGRTKEGVEHLMNFIEENPDKVTRDFLALIVDCFKYRPSISTAGFHYRGTLMIKKSDTVAELVHERSEIQITKFLDKICFFYSGIGGQAPAIAKELQKLEVFSSKLSHYASLVAPFGIDLIELLTLESMESAIQCSLAAKFVTTTALQVILTEILTETLEIVPSHIVGHSFGEIAAAHAQGWITAEQAILISYNRGRVLEQARSLIPNGLLAAVGLSYDEAKYRCPSNVFVACNNDANLVTISGEKLATKQFINRLTQEGIFVRELDSADYPLHTPYLDCVRKQLKKSITEIIFCTRDKSAHNVSSETDSLRWLSTCQPQEYMEQLHAARNEPNFSARLADYFLDNLLKPVCFTDALGRLPDSCVVLEVSGRELFEKVITRARPSVKYLSVLRAAARTPEQMLNTLADLYRLGFNPSVERLYPEIQWPVCRGTQSISSLLKWDHSDTYHVKLHPNHYFKPTESDLIIKISDRDPELECLFDHIIDGRAIVPGTAFLFFAWKRFAESRAKNWTQVPIRFESVQFKRPVFLKKNQQIVLKIRFLDSPSGEFVVMEGPNVICVGMIKELKPSDPLQHQHLLSQAAEQQLKPADWYHPSKEDVYKDLRTRGYDYGPRFKCIADMSTDLRHHAFAHIRWLGNMIIFLDNLFQFGGTFSPVRKLMVPAMIPLIKIDPHAFFAAVEQNDIASNESKDGRADVNGMIMTEGDVIGASPLANEASTEQAKKADILIPAYQRGYVGADAKTVVAPGIELHKFTFAAIGRKVHQQAVSVESYQFVAHVETAAPISASNETKYREYEALCARECCQLMNEFKLEKLSSIVQTAFELNAIVPGARETYLNGSSENAAILKIFAQALADCEDDDVNNNSEMIMNDDARQRAFAQHVRESAAKLCIEPDVTECKESILKRRLIGYLHTDIMTGMSYDERLVRPLVDIVGENLTNIKQLSVLQLSPVSMSSLAVQIDRYLNLTVVFKLNIQYICAQPASSQSDVDSMPIHLNQIEWNIQQEPVWPSSLSTKESPNLIVLYDEPLLHELQLTSVEFWQKLQSVLHQSGFVLIVLRRSFSPLEQIAYESIVGVKIASAVALKQRIDAVISAAAAAANFLQVGIKSDELGHCAILLRRNQSSEASSVVLKTITYKQNQNVWLREIQEQQKAVVEEKAEKEKRIWLLADARTLPGIFGFFNCLRKELGGRAFRLLCLQSETKHDTVAQVFDRHRKELIELDLAVNVFRDNTWGSYRHLRSDLMHGTRISQEYQLNFNQKSDLNSLTLFDITSRQLIADVPKRGKAPEERRYAIYSSALNFRDVMLASGRMQPPIEVASLDCMLGTEFAGRDCETGARVFGILIGGSFATTAYVTPSFVRPIPSQWSFDEAVSTLTTYLTVWYGLVHKARLRSGSTVLIHCAAGGVGQAALHVCKAYGCRIFATAGNDEKRRFIHEQFNIPAEHILGSRDCKFEEQIRQLTDGRGVDYVLNSLIGEQLDASLRLVADNGHFIELAKYEMMMNKRMDTFPFLRNITYHGVAIEHVILKEQYMMDAFFDWLLTNCGPNQAVQPISTQVFTIEDAANAFKFMTTGNHKGKIIIRIRPDDNDIQSETALTVPKPLKVQTKTYFEPHKSYILVGGCGGVGLELAHWLVERGAKRLVLTTRRSELDPYQALTLASLELAGEYQSVYQSAVTVYNRDISTEDGVRQLLKDTGREWPIGGIFHLAVSVNDALFENMTPELWRRTLDSKATLGQHLDRVSRELCGPALDYFVCFSSISAGRGNMGQTNYGYANSALDNICERRRRDGLHGLSLQYGPIGDVGLLSDPAWDLTAKISNLHLQRIISCLDVLDRAMQSDCAIVASSAFVDRAQQQQVVMEDGLLANFWLSLSVDPDTLPEHVTLGELGMESVFAVEIQQAIKQEYDVRLSLQDVKRISVSELKNTDKSKIRTAFENIKNLKIYVKSIRLSMSEQPTEPLNSAMRGEPIFMLPSVLGIFGAMRSLAERIRQPVIALHPPSNGETDIKAVAKHYASLLRRQYPDIKRFNLIGLETYGALLAMKMARGGLPCRVALIDMNLKIMKKSSPAIDLSDDRLYDQLSEYLVRIMFSGALGETHESSRFIDSVKRELLTTVAKEATVEGKVSAICHELVRFMADSAVKTDHLERIISGALKRTRAMFDYGAHMSKKKMDQLKTRFVGQFSKATGSLLVIKDRNSAGFLSNCLLNDINKELDSYSRIKFSFEILTLHSAAKSINEFFESE